MELAGKIEGNISSYGIHACGVVIGEQPLVGTVPLRADRRTGRPGDEWVTEWDARDVEQAGLVKLDLLFLNDLNVFAAALAMIADTTGEQLDINAVPTDRSDPRAANAYSMLAAGRTAGVFQLSGAGITDLCRQVRPASLQDLSALVALYRPGPMGADMHLQYARRKNGLEPVDYTQLTGDPAEQQVIAAVLDATLGVVVYQEQLMQLGQVVADFQPEQTNRLRKAFSKKLKSEMDAVRELWFTGGAQPCRTDGSGKVAFTQQTLANLWVVFSASADYLFNASHSFAYGYLAFVTAYLKANWPSQYGAALLANVPSTVRGKRLAVMTSLREEGVAVLGPDVNQSRALTCVDSHGQVRVGLTEAVGVGEHASWVVHERDLHGPYASLADLLGRVHVPQAGSVHLTQRLATPVVEGLIEAGALDRFGPRLGQLMALRAVRARPELPVPDVEWGVQERSLRERQRLGLVAGEHPLAVLGGQLADVREPSGRGAPAVPLRSLPRRDGTSVATYAAVAAASMQPTAGGPMLKMTLDSPGRSIDAVMFAKTVAAKGGRFAPPHVGQLVGVSGRLRSRQEAGPDGDAGVEETLLVWDVWPVQVTDNARQCLPVPRNPLPARQTTLHGPDTTEPVETAARRPRRHRDTLDDRLVDRSASSQAVVDAHDAAPARPVPDTNHVAQQAGPSPQPPAPVTAPASRRVSIDVVMTLSRQDRGDVTAGMRSGSRRLQVRFPQWMAADHPAWRQVLDWLAEAPPGATTLGTGLFLHSTATGFEQGRVRMFFRMGERPDADLARALSAGVIPDHARAAQAAPGGGVAA